MARKLKVFRTAIGFHDAYVAAPSRKAALAAWGADVDLFARGVAEEVTDAALTVDALARPGEVIRRSRGTAEEHFAALPATPKPRKAAAGAEGRRPPTTVGTPRPDRSALDAADGAVAAAERAYHQEVAELERRERALADERRHLARRYGVERTALDASRDEVKGNYERAMEAWRNDAR